MVVDDDGTMASLLLDGCVVVGGSVGCILFGTFISKEGGEDVEWNDVLFCNGDIIVDCNDLVTYMVYYETDDSVWHYY